MLGSLHHKGRQHLEDQTPLTRELCLHSLHKSSLPLSLYILMMIDG